MSADGNTPRFPLRAPSQDEQLTPAELQRKLSQLTAAVKGDQLGWALEVMQQVARNQEPPSVERTGLPAYMAKATPAIQAAALRAYARGEAELQLRASLKAETVLRGAGKLQQATALQRYHKQFWHIDAVSGDMQDREAQLRVALDRRYGR